MQNNNKMMAEATASATGNSFGKSEMSNGVMNPWDTTLDDVHI